MKGTIDYDGWYPEVPAVMDIHRPAELLSTASRLSTLGYGKGSPRRIVSRGATSPGSYATRSSIG